MSLGKFDNAAIAECANFVDEKMQGALVGQWDVLISLLEARLDARFGRPIKGMGEYTARRYGMTAEQGHANLLDALARAAEEHR